MNTPLHVAILAASLWATSCTIGPSAPARTHESAPAVASTAAGPHPAPVIEPRPLSGGTSAVVIGAAVGPAVGPTPMTPELCRVGGDEDGDGLANCEDPDCWGSRCPEDCFGAGDEDADGLTECEDADCVAACSEDCADLVDNDLDGDTDCADPDCGLDIACWTALTLTPVGGADLRLRVRTWHSFFAARGSGWTHSVTLDTLDITGEATSPSGGLVPCAFRATGLRIAAGLEYVDRASATPSTHYQRFPPTGALTAVDGICPIPSAAALGVLDLGFGGSLGIGGLGAVDPAVVATLRVLQSPDRLWGLEPAGVHLDPPGSFWRAEGWGWYDPAHGSTLAMSPAWHRTQSARADTMVVVVP
jgi:hypothetical protein